MNIDIDFPGGLELGVGGGKLLLALGLLFGMWCFINWRTDFDDHVEIFRNRNWAYLAVRVGMHLALVMPLLPPLKAKSDDWMDFAWIAGSGVWATVILWACYPVVTKLVCGRFMRLSQLRELKTSAGLAIGSFYFAAGWVLMGTQTGSSPDLTTAITAVLILSVAGIVGLVLFCRLHNFVVPFKMHEEIRNGKMTAGLEASGAEVAFGIALYMAIAGDFTSWPQTISGILLMLILTLPTLYAFRWLSDRLLLRHFDLEEINKDAQTPAAVLLTMSLPVAALIVSATAVSLL